MAKAAGYVPYEGPLVTRAEAKAAGKTRYFTGKPCRYGHVAEQWATSGTCDACQRAGAARRWADNENREKKKAQTKAWQQANREQWYAGAKRWTDTNPERVEAYRKAWRTANKGKLAATAAAWRAENPERFKDVADAWREANRPRVRCIWRNRRARVRNADGKHTVDQIQDLLRKQKEKCASCRKRLKAEYHADHIVPLARGGSNDIGNIQLLCAPCNLSKGHNDPIVWAQKKGRLL
jgi:5-methylcytosine-specific restriction endonuclease McrA